MLQSVFHVSRFGIDHIETDADPVMEFFYQWIHRVTSSVLIITASLFRLLRAGIKIK